MLDDAVAQWALTGLFLVLSVHIGIRLVVDRANLIQLIGHLFHLVMALDMALMWWPVWTHLNLTVQVVVFGAGGLLFALLAYRAAATTPRTPQLVRRAWHQLAHAAMMLAMVWMVVAMRSAMGAGHSGGSATGHQHETLTGWTAYTGVPVTAALIIAGTLFIVELLDSQPHRGRPRRDAASFVANAVMSFGMAGMGWLMLAS